jgi:hypothetical protein
MEAVRRREDYKNMHAIGAVQITAGWPAWSLHSDRALARIGVAAHDKLWNPATYALRAMRVWGRQ